MPSRPIVPDRSRPGRWHIAGTLIAVDALQRDMASAMFPGTVRAAYRAMGLTDAEIDDALAFAIPAAGPVEATANALALTIRCVCGAVRETAVQGPRFQTDPCSCGRIWQIGLKLTPTAIERREGDC